MPEQELGSFLTRFLKGLSGLLRDAGSGHEVKV